MRSRVFSLIALVIFGASWFVSLTTHATVVMKLSDEAMVDQAGTILTGTVTSIRSEWNDERTRIYTYITISPQSFLKGEQNQQPVVIKQLGGEVGEIGMLVEGTSVFEQDEEVFLFLRKGQQGFHRVLGMSQGKYSIATDSDTQRQILVKKRNRRIRGADGKIGKEISAIRSNKKMFLDDFKNRIQNILQQRNNN